MRGAAPHAAVAALCAGIAATNAVRFPPTAMLFLAALAAFLAAIVSAPARAAPLYAALALAGLAWGSVRLDAIDRSPLTGRVGQVERALAVVSGPARRGSYGLRVPAHVRRFGALRPDEPVQLELPLGRAPAQGAIISLIGELRLPRSAGSGFDERHWLRRHGIHTVLRASHWRVVGARGGLGGLADRLRARLDRSLAPGLRGERRAVIAGVVLGDDEGLSQDLRDDFRAAGLYHLLAVSGQNVALVAGGVLLCAWLLGMPRRAGELGALGAIGAYVLAVGPQPSVVRAGVAGALVSLAWLTARATDRWYFLLLGALTLLAWNPYTLLDVGFQLSFAAVAAIFVLVPRIARRLEGYPLPRPLALVVALSSGCGLATAPILWLRFHELPLLSVPANALAAPAAVPLLGLGLAAAALDPILPAAAVSLAWLNGWCAAYLAACARLVGGLPFATVRSGWTLVPPLVLAALIWSLRLPAARARPRAALAAIALVASSAAALVLGWRTAPPAQSAAPPSGLRITFLDVGQGDGILLQVPEGAVLVDQGPPEADVAGQLARLGVTDLDAVVLTHPQRDHVGGAAAVLEHQRVDLVLDPGIHAVSLDERAALVAARSRGVPVVSARAGRTFRLGRLRLQLLWPEDAGAPDEDPNRNAVVILASFGAIDALLTADAESEVTARLRTLPVEILKVAHHGSADPGLPALLAQLRPSVAVVSVGAENEYGHPAPSTVTALEDAPGLAVLRTDRRGRVVLESDGRRLRVLSER